MRPEFHLLRKVGRRPLGQKVDVGALAREFGVSQAMICDMIAWLVRGGRLDAATLRETKPLEFRGSSSSLNDVPASAILPEILRFLDKSGISPTGFGRRCLRDPRFVLDLMNGERKGVRSATADKIRRYITEWKSELADTPRFDAGLALQLERLAKGGQLLPVFVPRKAPPDQTFGGVVGEIN